MGCLSLQAKELCRSIPSRRVMCRWKIGCENMGKSQRDKGYRVENNVRKKAIDHGLDASYRVPLSGGGSIKGDIVVGCENSKERWTLEVKCRASGFKQIYDWIEGNDGLVIKADGKRELVVLDMGDFFDLVAGKHSENH